MSLLHCRMSIQMEVIQEKDDVSDDLWMFYLCGGEDGKQYGFHENDGAFGGRGRSLGGVASKFYSVP